jgi:hypothetical protein
MRYHRFLVVFISSLIVLLVLAAIARADSPEGQMKLGDHLNFNAPDPAGNQAGFALFGQDRPRSSTDDGVEDAGVEKHPVAAAIAAYIAENYDPNVTYEAVMALHEQGFGFGAITKAYLLAPVVGQDQEPAALLNFIGEAREKGWGNVLKEKGVHPGSPGSVGTVMGNRPEHTGPPDHAGPPAQAGKRSGGDPDPVFEQNGMNGELSAPGQAGNPDKSQGSKNGKAKGKNK